MLLVVDINTFNSTIKLDQHEGFKCMFVHINIIRIHRGFVTKYMSCTLTILHIFIVITNTLGYTVFLLLNINFMEICFSIKFEIFMQI